MKVVPGNLYAAKGGKPTKFWLVVSVRETSASMLGLDEEMNITTAQTYGTYAMERRPLLGTVDITKVSFQPG